MKRSGLSAICMTFAIDYQPGGAYDRLDRQLIWAPRTSAGVSERLCRCVIKTASRQSSKRWKVPIADENLRELEEARKFPDARCSLENGSFTLPLKAGDNEVAVAIANNFFGWGLMLRLADPEGVRLAGK